MTKVTSIRAKNIMKETMKVIEAIGQLKIQEDRFRKELVKLSPLGVKRASSKKIDGKTIEEFTNLAKSNYDSVRTLLNRYVAMKEAINEFNASTKISVAGTEMSVASAIYLKEYGLDQKELLLNGMTRALSDAEAAIQRENGDKLDGAAERNAAQNFDGDKKSDPAGYMKFLADYKEQNQYEMVDPLHIRDEIAKLTDEITKFRSSVDTAIQIANATHDITIEY